MTSVEVDLAARQNGTIGEIQTEILEITPEIAEKWLTRNDMNRPRRKLFVTQLAEAIRRGEWRLNGEAIRFDRNGVLLDGQHRLTAVVEAGLPIRSVVMWGLEPDVRDTVDTGRRRSLADVLAMHGEVAVSNLAAALNLIHLWNLGEDALRSRSRHRLSPPQGLALLAREPGIREAVSESNSVRVELSRLVTPSVLVACWYRFSQLENGREDCEVFWEKIALEEGLNREHPCFALRRLLVDNAYRRNKTTPMIMHAWIIKAWNAFRSGETVGNISYKAGGKVPERFPVPI